MGAKLEGEVAVVDEGERAASLAAFQGLGLCAQLAEAAVSLGWKRPTEIQEQSIPRVLAGQDVIGIAQTGSGKTGAFALPILEDLLKSYAAGSSVALFALVLSPTRELAMQIADTFEALGAGVAARAARLVGGMDMMAQTLALSRRPHVVVGTPGRVVDHLTSTKGFSLRSLQHLVLDEADRLLSMDFESEIDAVVRASPLERRTQLFSATMTTRVAKLQRACLRSPARVEAQAANSTVDGLRQEYAFVPARLKDAALAFSVDDVRGAGSAIVFVRTCDAARRLALALRALGAGAVGLHGQMSQSKRLAALAKFRAGERDVLVATDVAARGLDIPAVDAVINYDLPGNPKDYVHRVGRTARAGRTGRALTLVTQYDVEAYQRVEQLIGKKLPAYDVSRDELALIGDRVGEATRLAMAQMKEADSKKGKKRSKTDDDDGAFGGDAGGKSFKPQGRPRSGPGGGARRGK